MDVILVATAAMTIQPRITMYTHMACPFAQRVLIALEATELTYNKVEVNLYGADPLLREGHQ